MRTVIFKHLRGSGKGTEASPAAQMAAHISRIAGQSCCLRPLTCVAAFHQCAALKGGGGLACGRTGLLRNAVSPKTIQMISQHVAGRTGRTYDVVLSALGPLTLLL